MLLNLTNHPSASWQDIQRLTAENLYTRVLDIPFPRIPPDEDEKYVAKIADTYADDCEAILRNYPDENNAVHIMGEFTFVAAAVNRLLRRGIACVASTTNRITEEQDGVKVSKFVFSLFRAYIDELR